MYMCCGHVHKTYPRAQLELLRKQVVIIYTYTCVYMANLLSCIFKHVHTFLHVYCDYLCIYAHVMPSHVGNAALDILALPPPTLCWPSRCVARRHKQSWQESELLNVPSLTACPNSLHGVKPHTAACGVCGCTNRKSEKGTRNIAVAGGAVMGRRDGLNSS